MRKLLLITVVPCLFIVLTVISSPTNKPQPGVPIAGASSRLSISAQEMADLKKCLTNPSKIACPLQVVVVATTPITHQDTLLVTVAPITASKFKQSEAMRLKEATKVQ
jgi:hypothetical protein